MIKRNLMISSLLILLLSGISASNSHAKSITCNFWPGGNLSVDLDRHKDSGIIYAGSFKYTLTSHNDRHGVNATLFIEDTLNNKLHSHKLWQMGSGRVSVRNQFVGDHGFTGLNYLYHPTTNQRFQYVCKITY